MWSLSWSLLLSPSFFRVVNSFLGWGSACAQLEQSIKNGRDIRPGNCRPFLSGSRRCAEGERKNRARRPRKAFSRPPTHSAVLSADTFLWRRSSLSFHGDLIRPLLLVTRTRRQAEQSEQTEMDLIICGRLRE